MEKTPKSLRLHIGFFGKRNAGKSSVVNRIANQNISIVSDVPGTTTDAVEKAIELIPLGAAVLIDTAGIDDVGDLGQKRIEKTKSVIDRTDIGVIVSDNNGWDDYEYEIAKILKDKNIPVLSIINKCDIAKIEEGKLNFIKENSNEVLKLSAKETKDVSSAFIEKLIKILPEEYIDTPKIIADKLPKSALVVLVIPVDKEAPKGRLILPQVQTLRELLDEGMQTLVVRDTELAEGLKSLNKKPDLVITDSQAFKKVNEIVPKNIYLTSFSILFAGLKGDLNTFYNSTCAIDNLENGSKILVCESCTHHSVDDDIAKVKIPKLLRTKTGKELVFEYLSSHDFCSNPSDYDLIIHCGACMTNRREILSRISKCKETNTPITNYGMTIAYCLGILPRAIEIFKDKIR